MTTTQTDAPIDDGFLSENPRPTLQSMLPMFRLGRLVSTPGARALMKLDDREDPAYVDPATLLKRHLRGDWGELTADDVQANADALKHGARLMSVYAVNDQKLWVITEADRSATTFLLPEEY